MNTGRVVRRFVTRRTLKSATLWAFIFGMYTASKTLGYAAAAPDAAARAKLVAAFTNNAGLNALLGVPHDITSMAGYTAWNTFSIVTIIGSIWAFLLATKYFRGEEEAGRSELVLASGTTPRWAAANTLFGLSASVVLQFTIVAVLYTAIGSIKTIGIGAQSAIFFALSISMGTIMFLAIGALASQLMPTRSRAASVAAVLFGVFYLVRAFGDASNARWLLNITPLGWIENLRPLTGSHVVWFLPILGLTAACAALAIFLAGRRDLGDSVFADRDTAKPRTALLNNVFGASFRLTRGATLGWLAAISLTALFYGVLTKTAAQAIASLTDTSKGGGKIFGNLEQHHAQQNAEIAFVGVIFLILVPVVMCYAAAAVGRMRDEEAQGYVDNLLVRRVSRWRWLSERTLMAAVAVVTACLLSGLAVWAGEASQHAGVAMHSVMLAGLNMAGAVLFNLGVGVLAMGVVPRLTTVVAYSVVGWSFLMEILGSGLHLNHWLIDTSVLTHLSLAPSVSPDWTANTVLAGLGLLCFAVGGLVFNRRDLTSE